MADEDIFWWKNRFDLIYEGINVSIWSRHFWLPRWERRMGFAAASMSSWQSKIICGLPQATKLLVPMTFKSRHQLVCSTSWSQSCFHTGCPQEVSTPLETNLLPHARCARLGDFASNGYWFNLALFFHWKEEFEGKSELCIREWTSYTGPMRNIDLVQQEGC